LKNIKPVPPTQTKLPPMQPHVFTNFPTTKTADSVNVLLLDALNTANQDQAFVRTQMIKYLKDMKPGPRLAIFTLGSRLRMLQGFTTSSLALLAALNSKRASPHSSPVMNSAMENQADQQMLDFMTAESATQEAIDAMKQFQAEASAFQTDARVKLTLQAMQQLGRYLSGIPGRKNLIWFSGSFPVSIFPNNDLPDALNVARQYQTEIQKTADLLTDAQVAIYPLAAEGLNTTSMQADSQEIGRKNPHQMTDYQVNQMRSGLRESTENHSAMEELAKDTGGEALYNTNGLNDALARVINNGTQYYTLTYSPSDRKTDGSFRRIQIKLTKENYKLSYRRGYYSEDSRVVKAAEQKPADPLMPLMLRGLPDFTEVLYKIRVVPASPQPATDATISGGNSTLKRPVTRYGVDFAIAVQDLKLETTSDGVRHGNIEVVLVAYDQDGTPVNWVIRKPAVALEPKIYAELAQVGLQLHQEIDVPQGDVYLRTGIYDSGSSKAGTLGVPLSEVSTPTK